MVVSILSIILSVVAILLSLIAIRRQKLPSQYQLERRIRERFAEKSSDMKIKQGPIRYNIQSIDVCISERWTSTFRKYFYGKIYGKSRISIRVNGVMIKSPESDDGGTNVDVINDCSMLETPIESVEITDIDGGNQFNIEITVYSTNPEFIFDKVTDTLTTELPQHIRPNNTKAYG